MQDPPGIDLLIGAFSVTVDRYSSLISRYIRGSPHSLTALPVLSLLSVRKRRLLHHFTNEILWRQLSETAHVDSLAWGNCMILNSALFSHNTTLQSIQHKLQSTEYLVAVYEKKKNFFSVNWYAKLSEWFPRVRYDLKKFVLGTDPSDQAWTWEFCRPLCGRLTVEWNGFRVLLLFCYELNFFSRCIHRCSFRGNEASSIKFLLSLKRLLYFYGFSC